MKSSGGGGGAKRRATRRNAGTRRRVLADHVALGRPASEIIAARGFHQISDTSEIDRIVDAVLAANPTAVADYVAGKAQAVGFLVGQVMKATRGQARADLVQSTLRARLDGPRDEVGG